MATNNYEPEQPTEETIQENIQFLKDNQFEKLNISLQFIKQRMGKKKYSKFIEEITKEDENK